MSLLNSQPGLTVEVSEEVAKILGAPDCYGENQDALDDDDAESSRLESINLRFEKDHEH